MLILTASRSLDSFVQLVTVFFLFVFVLVITYFVTRWLAGIQKTQTTGTNVEVMETVRISNSKYLQIIRVGDKYLAIAVCKDTVTMLAEIPAGGLSFTADNEVKSLSFKDILDKMKKQNLEELKTDKENSNL